MNSKSALAISMAVFSLTFIFSCKKDRNESDAKQLVKLWYSAFPDTLYLSYDDNNRVNRVENSGELQTFPIDNFSMDFVEFRKSENRNAADLQFKLDADGRLHSGSGDIAYIQAEPTTTQYSFEYNLAGYMTKYTDARANGHTYSYEFLYTDGNLTTEKWFDNGTPTFTIMYEYDSSLGDKTEMDYDRFITVSRGITGKPNKNLVKHATGFSNPNNAIYWEYTYTYELDGDGFPVKRFSERVSTGQVDTTFYQYK